ncbi:hypothetical protein PGT21_027789 [Puccinia graminis f. sp. tritici]|uniref:Uncharacterized protein n=1 Tax=Puccinia graminis f. sp. tritici TaxID=56615 RepID=A0A5B0PTG3_PUCGR|nr:hypothetical protein PGT21_027789 [Puccinia graminis f. sp. tritici]
MINSSLMRAANEDLSGANGKQIGVNYLCTNTPKESQTVPKIVSVTVGSTLAVFLACFTLLVAVARRLERTAINTGIFLELQGPVQFVMRNSQLATAHTHRKKSEGALESHSTGNISRRDVESSVWKIRAFNT